MAPQGASTAGGAGGAGGNGGSVPNSAPRAGGTNGTSGTTAIDLTADSDEVSVGKKRQRELDIDIANA